MNILWVTNGIMPDMLEAMGKEKGYGGSWLLEPSYLLAESLEYNLSIVTPWAGKEFVHKRVKNIDYYLLPSSYRDRMKSPSDKFRTACNVLIEKIKPDVIHLHGGNLL